MFVFIAQNVITVTCVVIAANKRIKSKIVFSILRKKNYDEGSFSVNRFVRYYEAF